MTNQLACDDCLEFKEAYRLARESRLHFSDLFQRLCLEKSLVLRLMALESQDLQSKYDAVRCYKSHLDGVKRDRGLESFLLVTGL